MAPDLGVGAKSRRSPAIAGRDCSCPATVGHRPHPAPASLLTPVSKKGTIVPEKGTGSRSRQGLAAHRASGAAPRIAAGAICRMTGRPRYNHQTWHNGRNPPAGGRYVRPDEVVSRRKAIRGYALFRTLAERYADEIIRRTRAERAQTSAGNRASTRKQQPRRKNRPSRN